MQENVSEVFARLAVIFMLKIRNTGLAPDPQKAPQWMFRSSQTDETSRETYNVGDLALAFNTFSPQAQAVFTRCSEAIHQKIAALYGCEI